MHARASLRIQPSTTKTAILANRSDQEARVSKQRPRGKRQRSKDGLGEYAVPSHQLRPAHVWRPKTKGRSCERPSLGMPTHSIEGGGRKRLNTTLNNLGYLTR